MSAMKTRTIFDVDGRVLAHSNHRPPDDESVIQNFGVGQGKSPNWPNRWREWWKGGPLNLQVRQNSSLRHTRILAGLLPKSVMHCCARSCSLQPTNQEVV